MCPIPHELKRIKPKESTVDLNPVFKEGSNVPRKGHTLHRDVLADPIYNSKIVTKLVNSIMLDGKKGVAQKIVYGAFEKVAAKAEKDAVEYLKKQ